MRLQVPLVYLHAFVPGGIRGLAGLHRWRRPCGSSMFSVAATLKVYCRQAWPMRATSAGFCAYDTGGDARRAYITATVQVRLHQRAFRERVLRAYQERCGVGQFRTRSSLTRRTSPRRPEQRNRRAERDRPVQAPPCVSGTSSASGRRHHRGQGGDPPRARLPMPPPRPPGHPQPADHRAEEPRDETRSRLPRTALPAVPPRRAG